MLASISICLYVLYYFLSKPLLRLTSGAIARSGLPIVSAKNTSQRQALVQMLLVVVVHMLVVGALLRLDTSEGIFNTSFQQIWSQISLIPFGAFVGIGEAIASVVLAELIYNLTVWWEGIRGFESDSPKISSKLIEASLGGWMKTIRNAIEANIFVGTLLLVLQLACEEVVFRFLFPCYLPGSYWTAGILFVVMQFGGLKRPIGGTFAAIGALVMAISHSVLAEQGAPLIPLIVAHLTMFMTSQIFTKGS